MAVLKSEIKRFHRFHGYDYSRGAVLFITFALKERRPVFGRAEGDKVVYNEVGHAAVETMQREMKRNANLVVHRFVIMPDHVHLRIYIRPNTKDPLVQVGRFIQNFKRWSKWRASQLGVEIEWQENYHDRLCLSAEIIDLVDKYIDNNALKWVLMHGANPPMRVVEPIDSVRWSMDEWWTGVGNVELICENSKLAAFKLSRSIPRGEIAAVVKRCLSAVKKGLIPISTFISPAELALKRALIEAKLPMIRVVPDPLATVYRPKEDEPRQFAEGRLLLLSRVCKAGMSRYDAWHEINDVIAEAAVAQVAPAPVALKAQPAQDGDRGSAVDGGVNGVNRGVAVNNEGSAAADGAGGRVAGAAVYVVLNRATGRVEWRFKKS